MTTEWGMDRHGEAVTEEHAAIQIIEDAVRDYVDTAYRTVTSGRDDHASLVTQMRYLHLAEPSLPAVRAVQSLRAAGLL